jgi:phage portal protein BeeE
MQNYTGTENAHKPLLIEGEVQVERSVSKFAEMEFLRGREFLRQEIMMVLDMDPDKLGVHKDSNRSISKEADEAFHSEVIWPRQAIVEEEINNKLISFIFGWDDLLFQHREGDPRRKEDASEQMNKHQAAGRVSINDNRAAMGLPPKPGGDELYIMSPQGIVLVRDLPDLRGLVGVGAGGVGSTAVQGANPPSAVDESPPLTRREADEVSQNEPRD